MHGHVAAALVGSVNIVAMNIVVVVFLGCSVEQLSSSLRAGGA